MNTLFRDLSSGEYQTLIDAVPLIAILIAGADNEIDVKERTWAEKIVKIRSYHNHFDLKSYYKDVDVQFNELFQKFLNELPEDAKPRCTEISRRLNVLNAILKKLALRTASQLYSSYLAYAEQIARSSGGILRMMAVSREETMWVGLPMLDPIFYDDLDEEE